MDSKRVKAVLRGCMTDLPTRNSRIVRIFISSTFTDTREERNMLMEEIHPKLSTYCKEKYGLEYQVVDMRWGVPDDASDDHLAMDLCLQEIKNCQNLSTGPNFVTFLNQKHGYHHLQSTITSSEFDILVESLQNLDTDSSLLKMWYKQDTNSNPAVHILQPISSIIPGYKNKTGDSLKQWNGVYNELRNLFKTASDHAFKQGKITEQEKHKYFMSVTEAEIISGIFQAPGKPQNHSLCFIRIIDDLEDHLTHSKAWRFIDMVNRQHVDTEAQNFLSSLRDQRLTKTLDQSNIARNLVKWSDNGGINHEEHNTYLQQFCEVFYNKVKSLIDEAVIEELKLSRDGLYVEVLQHLSMAKERCSMFHGREAIIEQIQDYINGDSGQPLTVYGPSGSGKTSILAEVARQVPLTLHTDAIVVLRFLGTSPDSSNLLRLLQSLCAQILVNIGKSSTSIPEEFNELVAFFHNLLETYVHNSPLVIVLDSLDQLSTEYSAHKLHWLPRKLPKNVRMVLSTYIESGNLIATLKSLFVNSNFLTVKVLGEDLSFKILKTWLQKRNRSLTDSQFNFVQEAFKMCSLPLYVKLVFEEVIIWKSYTAVDGQALAQTVQDVISTLLQRLEVKHGKTFASRVFAYISASQSGLSESELEDILSLDDTLLTDVFRFHVPPVRRIPSLLWVRVRHDIQNYLADKEVDGIRVFFWYHRQFFETAEKRYLSDKAFECEIHSLLADYYLGVWHQKAKPFRYTDDQLKRLGLSKAESEADRKVTAQPISFVYKDGDTVSETYNVRKLNKLPFHLLHADRHDELRRLCLFNYRWLLAKLKATSVNQVLADFISSKDRDSFLQRILKTAQSTLGKYPETLAMEITGHFLPLLADGKRVLEKALVEDCLTVVRNSKSTLPYQTCYSPPSEALMFKVEHQDLPFASTTVAISSTSPHLLALTENNVVLMWDLLSGELEQQIDVMDQETCKMNIIKVFPEQNILLVGTSYQKQHNPVVILNMATGEIKETTYLEKTYSSVGFTDSLKFQATTKYIYCLQEGRTADVFERKTGKLLHEFKDLSNEIHLSPDESKIIFKMKDSNSFKLYRTATFEVVSEFSCDNAPTRIVFDPSGTEAVVMFKNSGVVQVFNLDPGKEGTLLNEITVPDCTVTDINFSMDNEILIMKTNEGFVLRHYKSNRSKHSFLIPDSVKPQHRVLDFFGHLTPDGSIFVAAYEGYLVIWNALSGKLLQTVEISRSKTMTAILSMNGEYLVTTSKRNNFISVWKISSLLKTKNADQPVRMKTATRYMCVSKTGDVAILRGTNANEVAVVDLLEGHIKFFISQDTDVMRPTITPSGEYAVLRAYDGNATLAIWSTKTGQHIGSVPLSSLVVKHYVSADDKIAVFVVDESEKSSISFWTLPGIEHIQTVGLDSVTLGDMCMFFGDRDDRFIISKQTIGTDAAVIDLLHLDLHTGESLFTLTNILAMRTFLLPGKASQILTQRIDKKEVYTLVLDLKSHKILREGKINPGSQLLCSHDGRYGIDKFRCLFDLQKMKKICQFDPDGEYPDTPIFANSPRIMPDGSCVVWLNIAAGLMMVGDVASGKTVNVCPIHSIPICMEITYHGLILVGCEDGRLMILQLGDDAPSNDGLISSFLSRHKKHTIKSRTTNKALDSNATKPQGQTRSSTCGIL